MPASELHSESAQEYNILPFEWWKFATEPESLSPATLIGGPLLFPGHYLGYTTEYVIPYGTGGWFAVMDVAAILRILADKPPQVWKWRDW